MPGQSHRAFLDERLKQADSAWRYSLLFSPARMQAALRSVYVFYLQLEDILCRSSDADLRAARLDWWRQELEAAGSGLATHPVTQSLPQGVLQSLATALLAGRAGGGLFTAVQQLGRLKPDDAVFEAGQRWYQLRSARLRGNTVNAGSVSAFGSSLVRPLAVLAEHTRRYDLHQAGFGPLLFAWRVARRSDT